MSVLNQSSDLLDSERTQQVLLLVVGVCTSIMSVWLMAAPPARNYDVSIYQVFPAPFWGLVGLGLIAVSLMFLVSSLRRDGYWKVVLVFVCVVYVLFNLLPLFRGWAMYGREGADILYHLGITKEMLQTGHTPQEDFYPVLHVLLAELRLLGFPARTLAPLLSGTFTALYISGVYLFSKELVQNRTVAVTTLACAVPLLYSRFQHTAHPVILSFMLLPMFLYLFHRACSTTRPVYFVLLVPLLVAIVLFHPVTSIYGILAICTYIGVKMVYDYFGRGASDRLISLSVPAMSIVFLMGGIWMFWYTGFPFITSSIMVVVGVIQTNHASVASAYGAQQLQGAQGIVQILSGFVNKYGPIFLVCGLAGIASLFVFRRFVRDESTLPEITLTTHFYAGAGISVVSIVTYVVAYNPVRNARYMILMATLLAGLLLYWLLHGEILNWDGLRKVVLVVAVVLLLVSIPISIMNTFMPGYHMTYSEKQGTQWFYQHSNEERLAISHHVSRKARMFLQGGMYTDSGFVGIGGEESPIPRFLGYRDNESITSVLEGNQAYLVTKEYDREFYLYLKEFVRNQSIVYTNRTLEKVATDPAVAQVYSNGGYTVWYVNKPGSNGTSAARSLDARPVPSGGSR